MKNTIKSILALALVACCGVAQAAYNKFSDGAMSVAASDAGWSVQSGSAPVMTVTSIASNRFYDGTAGGTDGNNCKPNDRAWMVGANITWPGGAAWQKATHEGAHLDSAKTIENCSANGTYIVGSGSGVKSKVEQYSRISGIVTATYWWSWITPNEAYAAHTENKDLFEKKLKLGAENLGTYKGVTDRTFTIRINTSNLQLSDGTRLWYPAVAKVDGKVYGDFAYALAQSGNVVLVEQNEKTSCDFSTASRTFDLNGFTWAINGGNITGSGFSTANGKPTLYGGTYSFNPTNNNMATLGTSCGVRKVSDSSWVVEKLHEHTWSITGDGTATLTAKCSGSGTCTVPGDAVLTIDFTGKTYDGTAVNVTAKDNTPGSFSFAEATGFSVQGATKYYQGQEEIAAPKYTGNYTAKITVGNGSKTYTLVRDFLITKPTGGYTDGWEVGNTSSSVRYDTWGEAKAKAQDGDTIYYHNGDINQEVWECSTDDNKNLTLDMGGKTLTYTGSGTDSDDHPMSIVNNGSGTLTYQNVNIVQPVWKHYALGIGANWSYNVKAYGPLAFGAKVSIENTAGGKDRYCTIEVYGSLSVTNGQYQCGFEKKDSGSVVITGGKFWEHDDPTAFVPNKGNTHFVKEISVDYEYEVVAHTHKFVYSADGAVVTCSCAGNDSTLCAWNTYTQTATLEAPNKEDDGKPYALAKITYTDAFPDQSVKESAIVYKNSAGTAISAPSTFGDYTAEVTIPQNGATAVKAFSVIHVHNFEYDADQDAGTITARCTTTDSCDFNVNKRIATLTANDGKYTGFAQNLASVTKPSDFPTNVVLTYSVGGDVLTAERSETAEGRAPPSAVGDYTATMTVADTVAVTKNFSIAKASMDDVVASMTSPTLDFTGNEQQNTLGSATLGSYNLTSGDYELSGVTAATGSGYSNETYQVTLTAKGDNFTGSKTIEWTILAPTVGFADNAMGRGDLEFDDTLYNENYGEAGSRELVVTASKNIVFFNNRWWVGATVSIPSSIKSTSPSGSQITPIDNLRVMVSTVPNRVFTGTEINAGTVKETYFEKDTDSQWWSGLGTFQYFKEIRWFTEITPAMVEQAKLDGKDAVTFTLTVGGIKGRWEGLKYTDFVIKAPVDGFVFKVGRNGFTTADIGSTKLSAAKVLLGAAGTSVTTTQQQTKGQIYTEVTGYQVYEAENAGTYTYSCDVATHYVTVPDVDNATKVVKVGETVIAGVENVYAVHYGDTVTIVYTPETGYETADGTKTIANVTADTTLTDLPTVTATSYAITYELNGGENHGDNPATYTVEDAVTLQPATKTGYTFTGWSPDGGVIAKGSTGAKSFCANFVFQTHEDPSTPDAAQVVIPQVVLANIVEDAENKTPEQINEELTEPDAKGITKVERYVLGLKMDDVDDVPVIQPVQTADATKVRVNVGNIAPLPPAVSGAKVRYSIETSSSPDFEKATTSSCEQQESPTFDLPLPTSGVMYYRAKIDLVKPE